MTARCKERIFLQIDAMYGGLDFEPNQDPDTSHPMHTTKYQNTKQKHLLY
jgi:hypothetical protein